ncbi:MAG: hypothetical protein IT209_01365 [Armatimonadetes bacterium]|nr:hypothetical protein [Armatimonadota bacterium]
MLFSHRSIQLFAAAVVFSATGAAVLPPANSATAEPVLTIRNNHDTPIEGSLEFAVSVPDGLYSAPAAHALVTDRVARFEGTLAAQRSLRLIKSARSARSTGLTHAKVTPAQALSDPFGSGRLRVDYGFVVLPGTSADTADVVAAYHPIEVQPAASGASAEMKASVSGYSINLTANAFATAVEYTARIRNTRESAEPAYVAFVRRVRLRAPEAFKTRYNGSYFDSLKAPEWDREFWYVRGVDWCSWRQGTESFAMINGVTPGFMAQAEKGNWIVANHFYVWDKVIRHGEDLYFVSEIAGPNPEQATSSFIRVSEYTQPRPDQPLTLRWRLARPVKASGNWQDAQLLGYAGVRTLTQDSMGCTVDLGVRGVEFGTSYFPYSTFTENFDYYRVKGLDRETWWPFSPAQWERWRDYKPQMRTDLRIIKAMGMQWVRLHHLELLGQMDRANALAFLDFYTSECKSLGLRALIDTAGSQSWLQTLVGRYKDVVKRVELENEVLIPGIQPGAPERWTSLYKAVKQVAPETQVFLTGTANQAVWESLQRFGVPFDRVGLHMYKHGPGDEQAFRSLALGVGAHASQMDRAVTLGEFNWKELTRLSPEERARRFALIYGEMLQPRAIPEFLEFHFQETLSVNPRVSRQGVRHYEIVNLDRCPKPETYEFLKLIRKYAPADSPIKELDISMPQVTLQKGSAAAEFTVKNLTARTLQIGLTAEAFDGLQMVFTRKPVLSVKPGQSIRLPVRLTLSENLPGAYHAFVRIDYAGKSAYGWLIASNPGAPRFEKESVLPDLVRYEGGAEIVSQINWVKPTCVTFAPDAPVLELEMAYLIRNTLQTATGQSVYLCQSDQTPDRFRTAGLIIQVASRTNKSTRKNLKDDLKGEAEGVMRLRPGQPVVLEVTGENAEDVEAAAVDFVLRYWKNTRSAAIALTGLEKGAALGNRAMVTEVNPP